MTRLERLARKAAAAAVRPLLQDEVDRLVLSNGELQARMQRSRPPASLRDAEYRVFSQWNEDGIIQFLTDALGDSAPRRFLEIGVGDYRECNTRFLAAALGWSGVAVDATADHVATIRRLGLDWRYGVEPVQAFVNAADVSAVCAPAGRRLGLLSIDVDGQDYWLLEALDVEASVLVLEYNAVFGAAAAVTVPADPTFSARAAHSSGQYFGASLAALARLAERKGYRLVGCESHGANAFFLREGVAPHIPTVSVAEAYRPGSFRTSTTDGRFDFADAESLRRRIGHLPVVDVTTGETRVLLP